MNADASVSPPPDAGQALDGAERLRLMRDGIVNNLSPVISGAVRIILIPIMLRGLGAETYGLWIIALSLPGLIGAIDFGLGQTVALQVAAGGTGDRRHHAADFVAAAGTLHVAMGLLGAAIICAVGIASGSAIHLAAANLKLIPSVIGLVALSHFFDRITSFEGEVLFGLRRLGTISLISTAAVVIEFGGMVALLAAGKGLIAVAAWHALVSAGAACAFYQAVARLEPLFRLRLVRIRWATISPNIPFSLASQFSEAARSYLWQAPPIVIGLVLGSSSVVPYHIGRRFPQAITDLCTRAAGALFPAVSEHGRSGKKAAVREILEVGTRWIVVGALPMCLGLWVIGPGLLQAWIHNVQPDAILILRLTTVAVFIDAIAAASIQVLWGMGAMRAIFTIPTCVTAASLGLTLPLLLRMGIAGAAWGLLLPMALGALAFIHIAARSCGLRKRDLLGYAFGGLLLPGALCLATVVALGFWRGSGWTAVIVSTLAGGLGYLAGFCFGGAREEERRLARKMLEAPLDVGRSAYGRLRRALAAEILRGGLMAAIWEAVTDSPQRGRTELNREFERRRDPWDYAGVPYQGDRIRREVELLDSARGKARFARALEVGCAEGMFTELLAERCDSLLAVDISRVALARARQRRDWNGCVSFAEFDLRVDPIPDTYDLIVIVHTLEYIRNPILIRRARAKLVNALRPGGHLLVGTMRTSELLENAWWGRYFLRSGKWINRFLARHPALQVVGTEEFYLGKDYVSYDVLFKKMSESDRPA